MKTATERVVRRRTAIERQQCIADTVVRRRDGRRRLTDHDECVARVGQQFMAQLGPTRLNARRL